MHLRLLLSLLVGERFLKPSAASPEVRTLVAFQNQRSRPAVQELTLVCFSYQKDFSVLATSLDSLRRACRDVDFDYVLVSDRKASFTPANVSLLEERLGRAIEHWMTPFNHGLGGLRVFLNELSTFHRLASKRSHRAWITKLDSDVLFLGSQYFDFLGSEREHDYVFQDVRTTLDGRIRSWPSYSQGGCYSFRSGLFATACQAPALRSFVLGLWEFIKTGAIGGYCTLAEDFLMYFHLARFARNPLSTTFFVPCPFRQRECAVVNPRFPSMMHFERCGNDMENYYAQSIRRSGAPANDTSRT